MGLGRLSHRRGSSSIVDKPRAEALSRSFSTWRPRIDGVERLAGADRRVAAVATSMRIAKRHIPLPPDSTPEAGDHTDAVSAEDAARRTLVGWCGSTDGAGWHMSWLAR
jgi:hypothetical protein